MAIKRNAVDGKFNRDAKLPYELRLKDFELAIQLTASLANLSQVVVDDFRKNPRGELGTRTATLHKDGIEKLRKNWVYRA